MAWLLHIYSKNGRRHKGALVLEDQFGKVLATSPNLRYMQHWDTLTVSLWCDDHDMRPRSERLYERCECRRCKDALH